MVKEFSKIDFKTSIMESLKINKWKEKYLLLIEQNLKEYVKSKSL
jgi:hypothetical protein